MNKKNFLKLNNLFVRFGFNYFVLLIVTICIGSYAYNESLNLVKRDAIESGLASLEQSQNLVDARLKEVESIVTQVSLNPRVLNFMNVVRPFTGPDYFKIQEMSQTMPSYRLSNQFIYDTYMYFSNDTLVSSTYATADMELMYERILNYTGMDYSNWRKNVLEVYRHAEYWPATQVRIVNNNPSVITYLQSIPMGAYNNHKGVAIVLIKEEEILKILNNENIAGNGWCCITDKNSNIITSINWENDKLSGLDFKNQDKGFLEMEIAGKNMIVMHTTSKYNGWRYVAVLPENIIAAKVGYIRRTFVLTTAIALVVGMMMAVLFAYRNSKPLKRLINKIKGNFDSSIIQGGNGYDFLEGTISKLIDNTQALKDEMEKQLQLARATFFERLLRGGFNKLKEVETVQSYIGMDLDGDLFSTVVVRVNGYNEEVSEDILNELNMARVLVNNVFRQIVNQANCFYNIDDDKIVMILGFKKDAVQHHKEVIENIFGNASETLNTEYNIRISAGVGNLHDSIINIRDSFEEALQVLEPEKEGRVMFYSEKYRQSGYYYPLEVEARLINLVKMGEQGEVRDILTALYTRNIQDAVLSVSMARQLAYELKGTIIKLSGTVHMDEQPEQDKVAMMIKQLESCETGEGIFEITTGIFQFLCEKVNLKKKSHNMILKEKLLQCLNSEYHREDLCLLTMASRFGLTENYLSHFFKEQTGESFTAFLEKIRMEQASRLLCDESIPVNDVAKKVGYVNMNTFYKAFKRFYGVSPSVFRQNHKYTV